MTVSPLPPRSRAEALDDASPLRGSRERFTGLYGPYLMGNSLGPLPRRTEERLAKFVTYGWGSLKVGGWAEWIDLPTTVGDRIGALVGAAPGQVAVGDSTSVQLHKLIAIALEARPNATALAIADDEFPTDRYVAASSARQHDLDLRVIPTAGADGPITPESVAETCADGSVAVVVASLVRFRTSAMADIAAVTTAAHAAGALMLWDLSHAIGAVPVDLDSVDADLAVGCTYKYLNAGPGAPAFAYRNRGLADIHQPIHGWFGQADQFALSDAYVPATDARQLVVGTPPVAGLIAVSEGVDLTASAGMDVLHQVAQDQLDLAVEMADGLVGLGVEVISPRDRAARGSHLALRHPDAAALVAKLNRHESVVDHRAPDVIRMAAAPLHTRAVDFWDVLSTLADVLT